MTVSSVHSSSVELRVDDAAQARVQTLVDVLEYRSLRQGEQVVFTFLGGDGETRATLTYGELQARARALAVRLSDRTIPGDRVVLLVPPGLDYVTAFFACLYAGVVAVPAYPPNPRRADPRVSRMVADCGARVAVVSTALMLRLESWLALTPELRALQWLDVAEAPSTEASLWQAPDVTGDSLAMLQYTSGSTGDPRGVMLSHRHLLANLAAIHQVSAFRTNDNAVFWLPPFHDMGLIGGVLEPIYAAVPTALMTPATFLQRPAVWLQALSVRRATMAGAPNSAFDLCVDRTTADERAALDLSALRVCFNGAEPVRHETMQRFAEAFAPAGFDARAMFPCYGLAEATLLVSGGPAGQGVSTAFVNRNQLLGGTLVPSAPDAAEAQALVTAGAPAPGTEIAIVDPDTSEVLGDNRVGEIWVSSASVTDGYWNRTALDSLLHAHVPGRPGRFLRTGDLGAMHRGALIVTGRLKDIIILQGRNYYPQDLEVAVTRAHDGLRRGHCAAFTVPATADNGAPERLVIAAEVGRHHDSASDRLIWQAIRRELGSGPGVSPHEIVLVRANGIPRTSSGKLQRRACRAAFLEGTLDIVGRWRTPDRPVTLLADATLAFVLDWIAQETGQDVAALSADAAPRDLGLDSLGMTSLAVALEERVGRRLVASELWEQPSVRAIVAFALRGERTGRRDSDGAPTVSPAESTDVANWPEVRTMAERRRSLIDAGLDDLFFEAHDGMAGRESVVAGRPLINFASYNYLALGGHPAVLQAAHDAVARWGTSASASRLISGERSVHRELEEELAAFTGMPSALAFVSGHATNATTIPHLLGSDDLVLCDALLHNSAMLGAAHSGARHLLFPHNDWEALDAILRRVRASHRRALVIIEGVYSADGDIPDLARFIEVKSRHHALLMVDEAHSLGVIGATGRGLAEHAGVDPTAVDIGMGTLSKTLASCGGYLTGRTELVDYLRYSAPGFVFSVGMTPANAAAALTALRVLRDEPQRVTAVRARTAEFVAACRARGIDTGASHGTAIVPVIVGDTARALRLSHELRSLGVEAPPMLPPSVPEGQARLRFFVSSAHTSADITHTVNALEQVLALEGAPLRSAGRHSSR